MMHYYTPSKGPSPVKDFFNEIPNKIATITEVTHHYSRYCSHESFGDLGPRIMQC